MKTYITLILILMLFSKSLLALSNDTSEVNILENQQQEKMLHENTFINNTSIPLYFHVSQNYPNPFNRTTNIEYHVPNQADVRIDVYNILGFKVKTILHEIKEPGSYVIEWDGNNSSGDSVSSGVYFSVVLADFNYAINKMVFIK